MRNDNGGASLRHIRTLFALGAIDGLSDGQLLDRFATRNAEEAELAFAALVERHGPMVLRVCRRILPDHADAQDAFQATFLILAQKSASIRSQDSIAAWLYGVASRVAFRSRSSASRRRVKEREFAEMVALRADSYDAGDLVSLLHEEIGRLPERYRAPVVLCDLEGLTHEQAAYHLGCPVGTVKSRLARGRARLGDRLRCHDAAAILAATVFSGRAGIPSRGLIDVTTSSALEVASGCMGAGSVPASVLSLATGVIRLMQIDNMKRWAIAASIACSLTGSGLAAAGMLAGLDSAASTRSETRRDPIRVEKPAPRVAPDSMIAYDVTLLETPGLSLRKSGLTFDFDLDPPAGLSFLSDKEVELLTDYLRRTEPDARTAQAPGVSASLGGMAEITFPDDHSAPSSSVVPTPLVGPIAPAVGDGPHACSIRIQGELARDGRYLTMNVAIRDCHVVELHTEKTSDGRRIEVPEIARKAVTQRVTIPDGNGGATLIGLGINRTVVDGSPKITERFVMIRARKSTNPVTTPPRTDATSHGEREISAEIPAYGKGL